MYEYSFYGLTVALLVYRKSHILKVTPKVHRTLWWPPKGNLPPILHISLCQIQTINTLFMKIIHKAWARGLPMYRHIMSRSDRTLLY